MVEVGRAAGPAGPATPGRALPRVEKGPDMTAGVRRVFPRVTRLASVDVQAHGALGLARTPAQGLAISQGHPVRPGGDVDAP